MNSNLIRFVAMFFLCNYLWETWGNAEIEVRHLAIYVTGLFFFLMAELNDIRTGINFIGQAAQAFAKLSLAFTNSLLPPDEPTDSNPPSS